MQSLADPLARFVGHGLSTVEVIAAIEAAKRTKPRHNAEYPSFGAQPLNEAFSMRSKLWPIVSEAGTVPFFWPHQSTDWPLMDNVSRILPNG